MSEGKDGQTLFHGTLPATARGLASKTAINWHLRGKDIEYNVGLTKNYCITVSMQKISSILKLIQQILGSHKLNDHAHFWPGPPRSHWNYFLFSWICTTMQKISSFQILEKTNDTIPRKRLDGRTDRPYFIGPFQLTPGV